MDTDKKSEGCHTLLDKGFEARMRVVLKQFEALIGMPPLKKVEIPVEAAQPGVYLFTEHGKHLYVGRTKDLRGRIFQHSRESVCDAPFAFRLARKSSKHLKPTYQASGSRNELLEDANFCNDFSSQKRRISEMDVRYVFESDEVNQALLEIYAADVLETPHNEFITT